MIEAIWPQLLLAVLIISAVKAVQIRWHYSFVFSQKMVSIHQILGTSVQPTSTLVQGQRESTFTDPILPSPSHVCLCLLVLVCLGSVLAFITVFRTNRSYDAYIEGRKLVSSVVSNLRTALMDMVRVPICVFHHYCRG